MQLPADVIRYAMHGRQVTNRFDNARMVLQIHGLFSCNPQALVDRCAAAGEAARVERCVLHLDLASLDLNQVRWRPRGYFGCSVG